MVWDKKIKKFFATWGSFCLSLDVLVDSFTQSDILWMGESKTRLSLPQISVFRYVFISQPFPIYWWKCHTSLVLLGLSQQWRHNAFDGVSNHQRLDCLLTPLLRRRSKKTSKPRVTCLCEGNPLVTGVFPSQRASNVEKVSIWWCHHG